MFKKLALAASLSILVCTKAFAIAVVPTPGVHNGASIDTTTTGAAVTVLPANTLRKDCIIQNQSTANNMYLTWDGTTASATNGLMLGAGQTFKCAAYNMVLTGQISLFDATIGDRYYASETISGPQ